MPVIRPIAPPEFPNSKTPEPDIVTMSGSGSAVEEMGSNDEQFDRGHLSLMAPTIASVPPRTSIP